MSHPLARPGFTGDYVVSMDFRLEKTAGRDAELNIICVRIRRISGQPTVCKIHNYGSAIAYLVLRVQRR